MLGLICWLDAMFEGFHFSERREGSTHHEESPDGVVGEDGAGDYEHCEAYETVELVGVWLLAFVVLRLVVVVDGWFLQGCWRPLLR